MASGTARRKVLHPDAGEIEVNMLRKKVFALLVPGGSNSFLSLKTLLKRQNVEVWSANSCKEVTRLVDQTHPELIFTGTMLPDGTWKDIVALANRASAPTNVIVVGDFPNTRLYLSTMDYGAFDFICPPFQSESMVNVISRGTDNVRSRRMGKALAVA